MRVKSEAMRSGEVRRSASQIMFGHLPEQTVDIEGGTWKVSKWGHPQIESAVDLEALTDAVLTAALPWTAIGRDGGLGERLRGGRRQIQVLSLDRENGIEAKPFPKLWICPGCGRVHKHIGTHCPCGSKGRRGQVHFVSYCSQCGELDEPPIARCDAHKEIAIRFPGSMSASDIIQSCPVCAKKLRTGFAGKKCRKCGAVMMAQVHRAASVYTPRTVAIVNAATRDQIERIERAGGASRALEWILFGMTTRSIEQSPTGENTLRSILTAQKLSPDLIDELIRRAKEKGEIASGEGWTVPPSVRGDAEKEARSVAIALLDARQTVADLIANGPKGLRPVYENDYATWFARAGLETIEYADRFPMLIGSFGYTRGSPNNPAESALVPYTNDKGDFAVYGEVAETEALFVKLDPVRVLDWLRSHGATSASSTKRDDARRKILGTLGEDATGRTKELITTLVHSYCHRFIKTAAVHTGVERTSLSEFLVPHHLGFFVYAAGRGEFVLGGLQAVFEGELHLFLRDVVEGESRCALDPGVLHSGAACMACLHLGEPSCRLFNQRLDRRVLHRSVGESLGYL